MRKISKILGGTLLVALMSIGLATRLNARNDARLEVRDVLSEDMTKPVSGKVVRFAANEEAGNKISKAKAQIADAGEGKRHIRFVVGIDSMNYADAKFNIVAKDGDTVVKTFADKAVTTAYTHIEAAGVVQSAAQVFGTDYKYFLAFTVNNVPESAWDYKFEVTSSVRTDEAAEWATSEVSEKVITDIAAADEEIDAPDFDLQGVVDGVEETAYAAENAGKNFVRYIEGCYSGQYYNAETKELSIGVSNPNANGVWYGFQLFAVPANVAIGTEYEVSFTLNSPVAGKVTVRGNVYDIVVGDNYIAYKTVYTGGTGVNTAPFSMQFGTATSTAEEIVALQNADSYVFKNFVMKAVEKEVVEEEDNRPFALKATVFGEEANVALPEYIGTTILYWNTQYWGGNTKINLESSVENEVATYKLTPEVTDGLWYGFQLFAMAKSQVEQASFTLNSSVAGQITVNGAVKDIVVGDNEIAVDTTAKLAIIFGVNGQTENNIALHSGTYSISNLVFGSKTAVEPEEPEQPEVPEGPYTVEAISTAGAGNHFRVSWTEDADAITLEPTKADFKVNVGIVADLPVHTLNAEQKFVEFNAVTGAEPNRTITARLHTENGDKLFEIRVEGGAYAGYSVTDAECTHTPVDPEQPEPEVPALNQYFRIQANATGGAANNIIIYWNDAEHAVTLKPELSDFSVNIGSIALLDFATLNNDHVHFNVVTGAQSERNVSVVLHTAAGDFKVTIVIVGGAYNSYIVEEAECNHTVVEPEEPETPEVPEVPEGVTAIDLSNSSYGGGDLVELKFAAIAGANVANIENLVLTVKKADGTDIVKNPTYNCNVGGGYWAVQLTSGGNGPVTVELSFTYNGTSYYGTVALG